MSQRAESNHQNFRDMNPARTPVLQHWLHKTIPFKYVFLEGEMRIELIFCVCKTHVLPLNYSPITIITLQSYSFINCLTYRGLLLAFAHCARVIVLMLMMLISFEVLDSRCKHLIWARVKKGRVDKIISQHTRLKRYITSNNMRIALSVISDACVGNVFVSYLPTMIFNNYESFINTEVIMLNSQKYYKVAYYDHKLKIVHKYMEYT